MKKCRDMRTILLPYLGHAAVRRCQFEGLRGLKRGLGLGEVSFLAPVGDRRGACECFHGWLCCVFESELRRLT